MPSYALPEGTDWQVAQRAALRIQCAFRCRRARDVTSSLRKTRSDEFIKQCEEDLKITAAITLQSVARKNHAKAVAQSKRNNADNNNNNNNTSNGPVELKHLTIAPSFATSGSSPTPKTAADLFYPMASASCFGTSVNRAFALASVASFAQFSRDDPETRRALQNFMATDFKPTLLHECAAIVIQCQYRVRLARRVVAKMRRLRQEQLESMHDAQLTLVAVQDIQRTVRGHIERKQLQGVRRPVPVTARAPLSPDAAALKIQCAQRQRSARGEVQRRRVARAKATAAMHEEQLVVVSTIEIQRHYRGFHQRAAASSQQASARPPPTATPPAPVVTGGSGYGLDKLFFAAGGALLDSAGPQRCLFWGVRILHAVAMELVLANAGSSASRLPKLEFSRWVQGPLGSVIPLSRSAVDRPRSGRLPALESRPTPRASLTTEGNDATESSPSGRKRPQLAPLEKSSSPSP